MIAVFLLPLDETIAAVMENQRDKICADAHGGFQFLTVHQKTAVSCDRENLFVRVDQFCRDSARNRNAHRRKTVRDDTGFRLFTGVIPRNPHLVRADVAEQNVIIRENAADIGDDLLRLHGIGDIVCKTPCVFKSFPPDVVSPERLRTGTALLRDLFKTGADIPDDFDFGLIKFIHMRGAFIDVDNSVRGIPVPLARREFYDIVSYGDHKICLRERLIRIIRLRDADRADAVLIGVRNDALSHHRRYDRDRELIRKHAERSGRVVADRRVTGEDQRMLCLPDHGCRLRDTVFIRKFQSRAVVCQHETPRPFRHFHRRDITGEVNITGAGLFRLRVFKSDPDDFVRRIRADDLLAPFCNRLEHADKIKILVTGQVHPFGTDLSRDCNERRSVAVRVGNAGHQICGAGTEGGKADTCFSGQPSVNVRHKSRSLLMPCRDEPNLRVVQSFHDFQIFFSRNSEDKTDAFIFQTPYK